MNDKLIESFGERGKKVHVALPLRITYFEGSAKAGTDVVCTYDIDRTGARVIGLRHPIRVGQTAMVERGRNKALFQISWIGDPQSELRGQFGIECMEPDKLPWHLELDELQELYNPVATACQELSVGDDERRRVPRFAVQGIAELLKRRHCAPLEAQLTDLSVTGCRVMVPSTVEIGAEVELSFRVFECEVSLQGLVRHADRQRSGIQFRSIRHGDRPLLNYLLRTVTGNDAEAERWNFEVAQA